MQDRVPRCKKQAVRNPLSGKSDLEKIGKKSEVKLSR
jgi:hypothetical protein